MKIQEILSTKAPGVRTIDENQPISEALHLLVVGGIGSLIVVSRQTRQIKGIISERDIIRGCHQQGGNVSHIRVADLMTRDVITCTPQDDISDIMAIMTHSRIRHLPVLEDGYLKGIVSIGDVVKALISQSEYEIQSLKEYLYGS